MYLANWKKVKRRFYAELVLITIATPLFMALLSSAVYHFSLLVGLYGKAPAVLGGISAAGVLVCSIAFVLILYMQREAEAVDIKDATRPRHSRGPIF